MYNWLTLFHIRTSSLYATDHKKLIRCDDKKHITRSGVYNNGIILAKTGFE